VTCVPWDPLEKSTSSTFRIQRAEKWSPEHRTCPVRHPPDPSFEAFAQSVLEAVRSWQYEPPRGGRLAFDLTFGFTPRGEAQLLAHGVSVVEPPPRSGPDWAKPRDMLRMEPEWLRQTIRAGGEVSPPTKLKDFAADYPPNRMVRSSSRWHTRGRSASCRQSPSVRSRRTRDPQEQRAPRLLHGHRRQVPCVRLASAGLPVQQPARRDGGCPPRAWSRN